MPATYIAALATTATTIAENAKHATTTMAVDA